MNYLPAEPMVHEYKEEADERQRRRIARMIGLGAIAAVALLVGFGAWSQSSRSADTIAVLEARNNAVPNVRTMTVEEDKAPRTIELPGNMAAFDYCDAVCPRHRVHQRPQCRYRQQGAQRGCACVDRGTGPRPAARPGEGAACPIAGRGRAGPGQCRSWPCYKRAHFATRCQGRVECGNRVTRTG